MRTLTLSRGVRRGWTGADIDSFLVLVELGVDHPARRVTRARRGRPVRRFCRAVLRRPATRTAAVAVVAYAAPLYVLAEVLHAVRGTTWNALEHHLDRVDDRLTAVEDACDRAGDQVFAERLGAATDRFTDVVCRMTARLARQG
jgi:hypothetical protein